MIVHQIETEMSVAEPEAAAKTSKTTKRLRVYMMDMWSFIPYYIGRLCACLPAVSVDTTLGSVRYHLDRNYFSNSGLKPDRFLLDAGGSIAWAWLRRLVKSCEYIVNLLMLGLRFVFSRPDLLHVQFLPFLERGYAFETWFLSWVRRRGIPVVYTVHNVTRLIAPNQGKPLLRRACNLADALICHGEQARVELIKDFGVPAEKIWVIPHGPLFEDRPQLSSQEARTVLGLEPEEPLIACLGVISRYKGIPFLLESWKRMKQTGTKGRLLIAGTGDSWLLEEIREKVASDGLADSVDLWLRFVPVEQLPLLYQAADILVYPYQAGTTSGALLTGLNYGKAIVATRLPFFQEHLKNEETALLVDYGDVDGLASSLRALIQSPEKRTQIGNALLGQREQRIGWQEIAQKTRACYETVLAAAT